MSLRVWLPLNGDLTNNGLSDVVVTNNGATVDNGGKIGKCYYFNGSAQWLQLSDPINIFSDDFSYAVWLKPTDSTRSIIISDFASGKGSNVAFELTANRNIRLYWNGSPDIYPSDCNLPINEWTHCAIVKTTNQVQFYTNGVLRYTYTGTLTDKTTQAGLRIGDDYRGGTGVSYMGYVNDVRIYDHALSPKEVKLLSQGLVCHYKLNDPYIEGTTNLITSLTKGGQTTVSGDSVTTSGENKDTYFTLNLSEDIVVGTHYTISCYAEGIPSGSVWNFPVGGQSNTSLLWVIHNGYNSYTFTANNFNWGTKRVFMDDFSRTFYGVTRFYDFQLEKNDHATPYAGLGGTRNENIVYDSSGYNNHAQTWAYDINSSIESSSETMRNALSTYVRAGDVQVGNTATGVTFIYGSCGLTQPATMTIAFWCKPIKGYNGVTSQGQFCTTSNILGVGSGTDYSTTAMHHRDGHVDMCTSTNVHKYLDITFTKDEWHHYAIVYDGRYGKTYKDGVLQSSTLDMGSILSLGSFTAVVIGYSHAGGVYRKNNSYYSDFRLYATPLSQEDIQELYNVPVSIANTGTMLTQGEFVEVTT